VANPCRFDLSLLDSCAEKNDTVTLHLKETRMSSIPSLSSATTPLPAANAHAHGGHKKGSRVSTDDLLSDDTTTAVPVGTQQNAFNGVLQSLQQSIAGPSATASTTAAAGTTANTSAVVSTTPGTGTTPAQSANTALQNYISNVSQQQRFNGSPAVRLPGSSVNINA
jgi:hypothetical protein